MNPLGVGLLYAVLSLDHFVWGPFLLSRPLTLGVAVGALCGVPVDGLALGMIGEALWGLVPPTGPHQWDVGLMTALAVFWTADHPVVSTGPAPSWALALAALLAFPWGRLGRRADDWVRRRARLLTDRALAGASRGEGGPIATSIVLSGVLWIVKGWALFLVFESIGGGFWSMAADRVGPTARLALERIWKVWIVLGAAVLAHQFLNRCRNGWSGRAAS